MLLAAGESSRFWPLSTHGHKSLHRLCGKAIIEHTVESLAGAGFTDIVVVQSPKSRAMDFPHRSVSEQLGDGTRYGATLRYVEQPEPAGQGDAMLLAGSLIDGNEFYLVQPENVNAGKILQELADVPGSALAVQELEETWLFGVCAVDGDRVTGIVEKPEPGREPSNLCNMGVAKLDRRYLDVLRALPPDPINSVLAFQELAAAGALGYVRSEHPFFPLKYPWHLFAIADYLKPAGGPYVGEGAVVDPTADVADDCVVEADAAIGPGARLSRVLVGAGSDIRSAAADSIFGAAVSIEPDVTVQTKPVTAGHVRVDVKGHEIDTNLPALGTTIGQGTEINRGSVISAGVLIGAECRVPDGAAVAKNLPDRSGGVETADQK